MSIELTQRAKALVAGAAFTAAMSLAVFSGVAQAQSLDGVVSGSGNATGNTSGNASGGNSSGNNDGNAGGNGGADAPAPAGGLASLNSGSGTTQDVAVPGQPLLDGATNSTTEAATPAVPAEGDATVDGTAAAGDILNEDVCLNAALNSPAGSCGGTVPADDADAIPGSDPGTALDGGAGVVAPTPVDGGAALDSGFGTDQYAAFSQPQLVGTTDSTTGIAAPVVPVQGGATVDQYVGVGDVVGQDVCLKVAINQYAETCADGTGGIPADPAHAPLVDGQVNGTAGLDAPAVPTEGSAAVDQYAAVGDVAGLDVCLNAAVNQYPGACDGGTAGGGTGLDAPVVGDVGADSDSGTDQYATASDQPRLVGATDSTTEVSAPAVPVEGTLGVDETVEVGDAVGEDLCLNVGVNREPGSCYGGTGGDAPTDTAQDPLAVGDVEGTAAIAAPIVPAQSGTTVDSDVAADGLADLGICVNAAVNQEPGTCGEAATGDGEAATADGGTDPIADGDLNGTVEADAPAVPVRSGALVESDIAADEVAALDVCLGAGVNQEAGTCHSPANGGDDGTNPADGGGGSGTDDGTSLAEDNGGNGSGSGNGTVPGGDAGGANPGTPDDTTARGDAGPADDSRTVSDATPLSDAGEPGSDATDVLLSPAAVTELALVEEDQASGVDPSASEEQAPNAGTSGDEGQGEAAASGNGRESATNPSGGEKRASGSDSSGGQGGSQAAGETLPDTGGPALLVVAVAWLLSGLGVLGLAAPRRRRNS